MNMWNKIVATSKLVFGGWESALDYVLDNLDGFLEKEPAASRVAKAYETAKWAVGWLFRLRDYCPAKWRTQYDAVYDAVYALVDAFADGKVESGEVVSCVAAFNKAVANWNKED